MRRIWARVIVAQLVCRGAGLGPNCAAAFFGWNAAWFGGDAGLALQAGMAVSRSTGRVHEEPSVNCLGEHGKVLLGLPFNGAFKLLRRITGSSQRHHKFGVQVLMSGSWDSAGARVSEGRGGVAFHIRFFNPQLHPTCVYTLGTDPVLQPYI